MRMAANGLVGLVALLHLGFLALEMVFWTRPLGRKTFRMSAEQAKATATLAANQGLYNGFLAGGLALSFFLTDPATARAFQLYFLSCVVIAGAYGAWTVSRSILFVQSLPAAAALALVLAAA